MHDFIKCYRTREIDFRKIEIRKSLTALNSDGSSTSSRDKLTKYLTTSLPALTRNTYCQ
jgi:hypothetical protein